MRWTIMVMTRSSGTSAPRSIKSLASRPSSVSRERCARSRSPLAMWGIPYFVTMRRAWVPLPAPTGPSRMRSRGGTAPSRPLAPNEAPIVAHDELSFELPHRVQRNADHDQHRGAGDGERLEAGGGFDEVGQHRHDAQK